jgi:hypothetical protein
MPFPFVTAGPEIGSDNATDLSVGFGNPEIHAGQIVRFTLPFPDELRTFRGKQY